MKVAMMRGPGDVRIELAPEPIRKPGEALLRVRRVGLCGSDLNSFRGKNPMVSFPRIPGHEVAATIVEIDPGVPHLRPGMNVTLSPYTNCGHCSACGNGRQNACKNNQTLGVQRDGALAEYISVPAEKLFVAELGLEELSLVEPLTVGAHAVSRGAVAQQDIVAILGCGGVGLGAVSASAYQGATTIAIDIDDAKLEIARAAGASHLVNSKLQDASQVLAELTDGHGPDVIIEAIGTPETFRAAVELVSFTGRVVYIGYAKELVMYETRLFVQKELDIRGARNAMPEDFRRVIRMLEQERFPVSSAINAAVPLDGTPDVLRAWNAEPSQFSKIIINLD
jgi:threonine dehydrogenase-like Zn-dependent dehydrogenase